MVPGPDFAVVLRWSLAGRRLGLRAAGGTVCGLLVHACAAAIGLSAVLATSAEAFTAVKLVGAGYLVVLGLLALRSAVRGRPLTETVAASSGRPWSQGFLTNVLNPKAALFFVALLPQFVSPGSGPGATVLLAAATVAFGAVWWPTIVVVASRLSSALRGPRVTRTLDGITGAALVGIGVDLAGARR